MSIIIIGAGLSGSLLGLRLAQRGYEVELHERRPDMRKTAISAGRSINLALSNRGIRALKTAGIDDTLLQLAVPMYGRQIHPLNGDTFFTKYSGREGEFINSISRGELNKALLNAAEQFSNLKLHFDSNCISVDLDEKKATFENVITKKNTDNTK